MSSASAIHLLRLFALESDRPRLAFALSRPPTTQTAASSDASAAYVAFARQQADALLRGQQYQAALFCLRDAIAIATAANDETAAIDLSCRVADVLETTDSPGVAAEEMAHVRSMCRVSTEFSRASVLHLKYLYEAGQDEAVVAEAITDERDPRCGVNLPEVMYTAWLACLRTPKAGSADEWCKAFLEHFPDHPLAVHLYFAAATSALAAGNTDDASRLLSFIEFHFPQSRMIDKVHQVQERLRAASGANASVSP